ncbi:hypothetical protein NPIL_33941 [Nephila pilipes]|uniref:Uncharacterized protein n=1 Tax=Nephila pilipes TaxID=299642 RepID=A0A8X6P5U4_NEPPI|nr:hypothetical protein NPIL_33941 [Nephila pilipes]
MPWLERVLAPAEGLRQGNIKSFTLWAFLRPLLPSCRHQVDGMRKPGAPKCFYKGTCSSLIVLVFTCVKRIRHSVRALVGGKKRWEIFVGKGVRESDGCFVWV